MVVFFADFMYMYVICYNESMEMLNQTIILIFYIGILIMSVVVHEVSHGLMALWLGDTTAKQYGRLTLNPIPHLDLFGSLLVPLTLWIISAGSFVFGWAKPVPYNPYNLKDQKKGPALVALAGPLSNLLIAIIFGFVFKFVWSVMAFTNSAELAQIIFTAIIIINIVLAIFNLIPIPPLDGSKILFAILPPSMDYVRETIEKHGFIILVIFLIVGSPAINAIINGVLMLFAKIIGI